MSVNSEEELRSEPEQGEATPPPSSSSSSSGTTLALRALRYKLSRIPTHELKSMLKNINRLFGMAARLPDGGNKLRIHRRELLFELGRRQDFKWIAKFLQIPCRPRKSNLK